MDVKIVTLSDDWQGIYVNGILKKSGREFTAEQILEALGIDYEEISWDDGDGWDFLYDMLELPPEFSELQYLRAE